MKKPTYTQSEQFKNPIETRKATETGVHSGKISVTSITTDIIRLQ